MTYPFPSGKERDKVKVHLQNRYQTDKEGAVEYTHRALDRQINKGIGLLTYDGLLLTALSIEHPSEVRFPDVIILGRAAALVAAAVVLVGLMWSVWGKATDYESTENDLQKTLRIVQKRTGLITISIFLSLLATVLTGFSLWPV